jgi:hypothetical protein
MNPKKFIKFLFPFLLFFMIYSMAVASESCLLFSISSDYKARLGVVNKENHTLNLEIINNEGDVFFTKAISGGQNYFQLLDLTAMPDGKYQVRLSGSKNNYQKEFLVNNHRAEIEKKEKLIGPSFHLLSDETLAVSYVNDKGKSVNIRFELNNEVVFEDRNIYEASVNKRYSLKQLPKGEYSVKLCSDGNTFSYPLVIK